MDELSFHIAFLVFEFGLRLIWLILILRYINPAMLCPVIHKAGEISVCSSCIIRRADAGCPYEHGGEDPFYMGEFHVLMRYLCIRYEGTLSGRYGRFIPPMASLHESPRAVTRRLENIRESSVSSS